MERSKDEHSVKDRRVSCFTVVGCLAGDRGEAEVAADRLLGVVEDTTMRSMA